MMFLSVTMGIPFHEVRLWSAAEITLYAAYYKISPWGEERADIRNAMSMTQVANMHRGENTKALSISDFMPFKRDKPEPEQTSEPAGLRDMFKGMMKK